jgi:hypothetical protein
MRSRPPQYPQSLWAQRDCEPLHPTSTSSLVGVVQDQPQLQYWDCRHCRVALQSSCLTVTLNRVPRPGSRASSGSVMKTVRSDVCACVPLAARWDHGRSPTPYPRQLNMPCRLKHLEEICSGILLPVLSRRSATRPRRCRASSTPRLRDKWSARRL